MRIGVFTPLLSHLPLEGALASLKAQPTTAWWVR